MSTETDWSWARAAFDEHFAPLAAAGYTLERMPDMNTYWALHERELRAHFPREVFFRLSTLRTPEQREGQARLTSSASRLEDYTVVRRGEQVAAMFCGHQEGAERYRMWHTNVHPEHRRQGLYRRILTATIGYTRALGVDTISSEHAPSNNAVIIAKLRAGFRIFALDLDPSAGVSLHLRYFHHPEHLRAYEFRCGYASLTPALMAAGMGAFPELRAQISGGGDDGDDVTSR